MWTILILGSGRIDGVDSDWSRRSRLPRRFGKDFEFGAALQMHRQCVDANMPGYNCDTNLDFDKVIDLLNNCRENAVGRLHKPKSGEAYVVKMNDGANSTYYITCCLCPFFSDNCCVYSLCKHEPLRV